jgi:hypothetical protein
MDESEEYSDMDEPVARSDGYSDNDFEDAVDKVNGCVCGASLRAAVWP